MAPGAEAAASEAPAPRIRDPEQTRRGILDAAFAEFAAKGLAGARVDEIAARTRTTKRMIYYYFGSKEGLYAAVLEEHYAGIRDSEHALGLEEFGDELLVVLPPDDRLVRDLLLYKKTEKYVRQNISITPREGVKRILTDKSSHNGDRLVELQKLVQNLIRM